MVLNEIVVSAIVALIASFMTAFIAWRKWPSQRKVAEMDAAANMTAAAANFMDDLAARIATLTEQVVELEKENRIRGLDLDRLRMDLIQAQERIRKLESDNKRLTMRVKELERENAELRAGGADGEKAG